MIERQSSKQRDWAWIHLAFGSAAVMVVSVFYVLSPSLAVSANLGVDLELARVATLTDSGHMRMAGLLGVLGDPFIVIGAHALAIASKPRVTQRQVLGFYWLAAAALIFTIVDALVGFALPAAARAGLQAFSVAKPLFDALTCGASVAYGISAVLVGWPAPLAAPAAPRWLANALVVVGLVTAVAGAATLGGLNGGLFIGVGLTLLTTLYTILGVKNAYSSSLNA